jgi:hypothetical protein
LAVLSPNNLALKAHLDVGRDWAQEVEIYDMRQYVHTAGSPLRAADIYSIAFEPFPAVVANTFDNAVCLQITDPKMEDQGWRDVFMNSCDWCKLFVCLCLCTRVHCIMLVHRHLDILFVFLAPT